MYVNSNESAWLLGLTVPSPPGSPGEKIYQRQCSFGIQEYSPFNARTQEIFHGCPEMKDGYLWVSEKPGWGIEIDEKEAKSPFTPGRGNLNGGWGEIRKLDGTVIKQ